jgi:hypothetical protein
MYTVKVTRSAPTVELMGPKKGKAMAKNHTGKITGILATARKRRLLVLWMPITFSHTK